MAVTAADIGGRDPRALADAIRRHALVLAAASIDELVERLSPQGLVELDYQVVGAANVVPGGPFPTGNPDLFERLFTDATGVELEERLVEQVWICPNDTCGCLLVDGADE